MGNVIRNVVELLVISIMVVMGISTGLLIINDGGTNTEFLVDNQTFTTDASMDFSSVTIDSEYIKFNGTGFYVDSDNDISITISFICENSASASDGDAIVSFAADTTGGTVWFNLSGFSAGTSYVVQKDSVDFSTETANVSGFISFSNSDWSSHTFDIYQEGESNTPPDAASNPSPEDGAIDAGTSPTLSVDVSDSDGDSMDVSFYDASDDSVIGTDTGVASGGSASVSWSGLSYSTSYSWYVIANDGLVDGDESSTWSFTTEAAPNSAPNVPNTPSPSDSGSDVTVDTDLSWSGGDPDGDDVTYDVYVDTSNPPTSKESSNQSETSFDPGVLSHDETYYWKIISWDEHGLSQAGPVWSFSTVSAADETPPSISNVDVLFSSPIDSSVGWENITCEVTDNEAVDSVWLNITYPNDSTVNVSMNAAGGNQFYYNTTFSSFGIYNYEIFAKDTSENSDKTISDSFTLYANWDVNKDGVCDNLDLVAISNVYGSTGEPGWLREDVDNNGVVQVLDLSIVSSFKDESYEV
jgi:hypothetical protein